MTAHEEEKLIRLYLLGLAPAEEQKRVEESLLRDDDYAEALRLVEYELIDDYLFDNLDSQERASFENHFLTTPKRKLKLALASGVRAFARSEGATNGEENGKEASNLAAGFLKWLPTPHTLRWKFVATAAAAVLLCVGVWWFFFYESPISRAQATLAKVYSAGRPFEARITGFTYAPFRPSALLRGDSRGGEIEEEIKKDNFALEQVKNFLFSLNANSSDPEMLHLLGKYYLAEKNFKDAIEKFKQALESEPDDAELNCDLGAALLARIESERNTDAGRRKEDLNECLKYLNKALELDPESREAVFNRTLLYQAERLRHNAHDGWEEYLKLDSTSPWAKEARDGLAALKQKLAGVASRDDQLLRDFQAADQSGDSATALTAFGQSYSFNGNSIIKKLTGEFIEAKLNGKAKEAEERLQTLSRIGKLSEDETGDRYTADLSRYYRKARPEQLKMVKQAQEMMEAGYKLYSGSKNDQAIEKFDQARRLFDQAGDLAESLFAEAWIGHCHHHRSDTERNLRIFSQLVPTFEQKGYVWMQANAYCGLANAHNSSGRISDAIQDTIKCGELSERTGDKAGLLRSMSMRGTFYRDLGKHDEALRICQRGLDYADQILAGTHYSIGFYNISARSLSSLGLIEAAKAFQTEAVKMSDASGSPRFKARAHTHLGLIYGKAKMYDEAISNIKTAIAIGEGLGGDETGQELIHYGLIHLGNVHREAGKYDEALKAYNQIIEFHRRSGRQIYLYAGSKGRLLTFIAQNDVGSAKVELDNLIRLYEQYRERIEEESNRNSFFDQEQDTYDVAIEFTYSKLNNPRQALFYSERSRARSLLDAITRGWKSFAGPEAPDLKLKAGAMPKDPDEIQRLMPDNAQIVEYAALADGLLIWTITKSSVEVTPVKIPRDQLDKMIEKFLGSVYPESGRKPDVSDQRWRERSADLYDKLIQPIESRLDKRKQLCFIPDKALNRLPFGALFSRATGKLLVEEHTLLYAPSASVFLDATEKARLKSGVRNESLLAIGDPQFFEGDFPTLKDKDKRLDSAAHEAREVANYYNTRLTLLNEQARKSAVLRAMERADVVHLASHYVTDPWSPTLSRIPMASNAAGDSEGALRLIELYKLWELRELRPRLVVLAACQTTAEDYLGGEGAIGAARPFEAAGIPLVVASLWPVDSEATTNLMTAFHRARKQGGFWTVAALRNAQLAMINGADQYKHPYYWAAFITIGGYGEF